MGTVDGLHTVAFILIGMTLLRGIQALAEHYAPSAEPVVALRFILGGP